MTALVNYKQPQISRDDLKYFLRYDVVTGRFYWRNPTTNSIRPGDVAGRKDRNKYTSIMVCGVRYQAHRLVWLWFFGVFPDGQLDHRNGRRSDNRLCNLRVARPGENHQNIAPRKDSVFGLLGITRHSDGVRWRAQIAHQKRKRHLGVFDSPQDAHEAYLRAKAELHTFNPKPRDR